jgi:hypothetical protein
MTSALKRHTLAPQLLFSFGPVEATWRGFLLAAVHRLHRLYRLLICGLAELPRGNGLVALSAAISANPSSQRR